MKEPCAIEYVGRILPSLGKSFGFGNDFACRACLSREENGSRRNVELLIGSQHCGHTVVCDGGLRRVRQAILPDCQGYWPSDPVHSQNRTQSSLIGQASRAKLQQNLTKRRRRRETSAFFSSPRMEQKQKARHEGHLTPFLARKLAPSNVHLPLRPHVRVATIFPHLRKISAISSEQRQSQEE